MTYIIPDDQVRTLQGERDLNKLFAKVFSTEEGQQVLTYLKSITTEQVCGPNVEVNHLLHLEGRRYLYGVIAQRDTYGREDLPNVPPEIDKTTARSRQQSPIKR